jgi:hypothetical protein
MKTEITNYAVLSERVRDAVLFNNHNVCDEEWYDGLITSPHVQDVIDALQKEREEENPDLAPEDVEQINIMDLCEDCIYQTYAITPEGARYLFNHTSEIISYSEKLDLFLWHIRHWGTAWSGVQVAVYDWDETPDWYATTSEDILKYKSF